MLPAQITHAEPELVIPLKRYCIKWHIPFGLALVGGLALAPHVSLLQDLLLTKYGPMLTSAMANMKKS